MVGATIDRRESYWGTLLSRRHFGNRYALTRDSLTHRGNCSFRQLPITCTFSLLTNTLYKKQSKTFVSVPASSPPCTSRSLREYSLMQRVSVHCIAWCAQSVCRHPTLILSKCEDGIRPEVLSVSMGRYYLPMGIEMLTDCPLRGSFPSLHAEQLPSRHANVATAAFPCRRSSFLLFFPLHRFYNGNLP